MAGIGKQSCILVNGDLSIPQPLPYITQSM